MVGGISAMSPYISTSYRYVGYGQRNGTPHEESVQGVGNVQRSSAPSGVQRGRNVSSVYGARASLGVGAALAARPASPGTPVEPVSPVSTVAADAARGVGYAIPFLRKGMDPAELAVRMRIKYVESAGSDLSAETGVDAVRKTAEEGECQTCKERKYQDGSDDAGVSYKTPTRIAPEQAASAVRGHEMEHVVRERAAAAREDRKVVSQSVTMHTAICPECGKVYVSGGTTRTTTAADTRPEQPDRQADNGESVAA